MTIRISPRWSPSSTLRRVAVPSAADDIDELDVLIGGQGPLGDQQRLVRLADRDLHADEQTAGQRAILVREHAPQCGRFPCSRFTSLATKSSFSFVREILFVGQLQVTVDAQFAQAARRRFARLLRAAACNAAATVHRRQSRRTSAAL